MNKELLKLLTLCKYIALGVLTVIVCNWICSEIDYTDTFLIAFLISLAIDFADYKYKDKEKD